MHRRRAWPQCDHRTQHFVNRNASDPPDKDIMKLQSCYYPILQVGRAGLLVPALPAVMESLGPTEGWLLGRGLQGWDCRQRGHFAAYICFALGSLEGDSGIWIHVKGGGVWEAGVNQGLVSSQPQGKDRRGDQRCWALRWWPPPQASDLPLEGGAQVMMPCGPHPRTQTCRLRAGLRMMMPCGPHPRTQTLPLEGRAQNDDALWPLGRRHPDPGKWDTWTLQMSSARLCAI